MIGGRQEPGTGRLWLLAPEALAPWRQAAQRVQDHRMPGDDLPELASDYWK